MRRRSVFGLGLFALAGLAGAIWAQEGHPLTGSWHGEWHPSAGQKIPVLIYMKWNSKAIKGAINVRVKVENIPEDEVGKVLKPEMSVLVSFQKVSK